MESCKAKWIGARTSTNSLSKPKRRIKFYSKIILKKEFRQMFGCIVELKSFVNKISPNDLM